MAKLNFELFEGEWTILQVVWEREPCAAPTVQEVLQESKGWAYTTVKTMMDRMARKGLLRTERVRNLYLYRSAVTRAQAQRSELLRAAQRAFNGALTPMMQFLIESEKLSDQEYQYLERLIQSRKRRKGSPGPPIS
jgi:BlaI family transcriptional regulator, penicillinase repressor